MGSREFELALLQNEIVEGSVVFIDICGFTAISESQPADKVVEMLNKYFDLMVMEIIHHQGVVDKFMGDALMGVFKGENHLGRAIEACIAIRDKINELPIDHEAKIYHPHVSTGINSGEMVSGNIGSSTLRRLDYTVIGDVVNVAARLQSAAEVGQILITERNFELVKDSFECKKIGDVLVKNKKTPLTVYEVLR